MKKNTQDLIRKTYINLSLTYPYKNIYVEMLCKECNIGKTTFYKFYKNLNEVRKDIEKIFEEELDEITKKYNYINLTNCADPFPHNLYDLFNHVSNNIDVYNYLFFNEHNPTLLAKGKRIVYQKIEYIYKDNMINDELTKCISEMIFSFLITYCNMIIKYDSLITPKGMTALAKDSITNLIVNQTKYFKTTQ